MAVLALWFAVHHIPGFGPLVADSLRAVLGPGAVAWMEDTAYGVEDWVNRRTKSDEPPKAFWEVPSGVPTQSPSAAPSSSGGAEVEPPFSLENVGSIYDNVMTKGDGIWVPLADPRKPQDRVRLLKTFVHPDKSRSWSIMAIVAVDLTQVDLVPMAGRHEPKNKTKEAKDYERKAVIPTEHHDRLIAGFNGGYKSTHGDYGMMIDGVTLVPPRPLACTIAKYQDGSLVIRSWKKVKDTLDKMVWLRQTPICMYDDGKAHPALSMPKIGWGASVVSGTTVIRRSAIGLNERGDVLYVGIGDFLTGQVIAKGMRHAGAHSIAQLDVNFSFPKFFTYDYVSPGSTTLKAIPLTDNFEYKEDEYVAGRAHRDFFYLLRKDGDGAS
ncbi:MAG: hypothetical protein DRI90_07010 [Deltaproteobacteria bacterium]|nr:MAG: hypothetical protein DRI90_07010 [Deltaproteobacteria bacterium]